MINIRTILSSLLLTACAYAGVIVAPNANTGAEGNGSTGIGGSFLSSGGVTSQLFLPAAQLSGIPNGSLITGLTFRLDSSAATGPASPINFPSYEIVIAPPSGTFSLGIGTLFSSNLGAGATTVYNAPLTIATNSYTGGGSPNAFAPFIVFTTPFTYTGTALVIQFRTPGSGVSALEIDTSTSASGAGYYSGGFSSTSGNASIAQIPVIELQFGATAVPEPATAKLMLCGGVLLLIGLVVGRRAT